MKNEPRGNAGPKENKDEFKVEADPYQPHRLYSVQTTKVIAKTSMILPRDSKTQKFKSELLS